MIKKILTFLLVLGIIVGQLSVAVQPTFAATVNDDPTSQQFNVAPTYDATTNQLTLPVKDGYTIEIFGSDNKATIALDGQVTRPLETQTVKLLYKITNNSTNTSITTEANAEVTIPAKDNSIVKGSNTKPQVIPVLREWVGGSGHVQLTNARIVLGDVAFEKAAQTFQSDYKELTGRNISIVNGTKSDLQDGDIFLQKDSRETMLGTEGYYLEIGGENATENYIVVRATDHTGALYGTISILQILKQDSQRSELPKGVAKDYPLFEQRGMMFDVARKWIPMEYLKDLSKQMSWYKLNMLSLHMSDCDIWDSLSTDGGTEPEGWFRLESETFPELTSKDHYTKKEFRDYQRECMDLGIDVIPELDTPGHALSYTKAWPGLQRPDNKKYLDVTNPQVLENVKMVFDEYINGYNGGEPTFIGKHVNIGTDEYKSGDSRYKEAFRKYCNDLLEYINSTGKEAVFWGSLTENSGSTEVTTDATMFAWYQGYANAKQSLDAGYKIVSMEDMETYIVPGGGYYSNQFGRAEHLYNNWLPNNNSGWAGNPAPVGHPGVSGGQFAVWNDFHGNGISVQDISYRIQHNLYAVAEKCWAGTQAKDEGRDYSQEKALARQLGDAPGADFMYEVDKNIEGKTVLSIDNKLENGNTSGVKITNQENVKENVPAKNGYGIQLNGESSYFETDLKSIGFDWSMAMWIHPLKTDKGILMEGKTGTLYLENGKIKYDVENYTHTFDCDIKANEWTHITLVSTYEGVKLYINGELFDSLIGKPYPNYNVNSGCNSWNGSYPTNENGVRTQRYYETLMLPLERIGSKSHAFHGLIDELTIYNQIVSENDIKKLMGEEIFENLALGKTVTSSGNEVADGRWTDNLVVDGDTSSSTSRWSSNYSPDAWLTIDLGSPQEVNHIKIYWEKLYAKKFKVLVSSDGNQFTEIFDEQNGKGGISDIQFETQSDIRYVKFQGVERTSIDNWFGGYSFYEMEVYGTKKPERVKKNVALNKNVVVKEYNADMTGDNAVDGLTGNDHGRWEFKLNSANNDIEIPLSQNESVDTIAIYQKQWGPNRIRNMRVVSIDENGNETDQLIVDAYPNIGDGRNVFKQEFQLNNLVTDAKSIKIYFTAKATGPDDLVNITEIELYGTLYEDDDIDNPPVFERNYESIDKNDFTASSLDETAMNAIDGDENTVWKSRDLTDASLTLNLGTIQPVSKIGYKASTDGKITQYKLEASIDGIHFTEVISGEWNWNRRSVDDQIIEFGPRVAQFVRLTALASQDNFASIAELNVYSSDAVLENDLLNLINDVEAIDLSGYINTDELSEALNAARDLKDTQASGIEIAKVTDAIQKALLGLETKGNKSDLTDKYNQYKGFKRDDYTQKSAAILTGLLNEAKAVIESEADYSALYLEELVTKIEDAHQQLIDITALKTAIQKAEQVVLDDATNESIEAFTTAIESAKQALIDAEDGNAVSNAISLLTDKETSLQADLTKINALIQKYDHQDQYTGKSWLLFEASLKEAQKLTAASPISDVTNARLALLSASQQLVVKADAQTLSVLEKLVASAETLNAQDYTAETWNLYYERIQQAKELLKDVMNLSQSDAKDHIQLIHDAVLIKKSDIAFEELKQAIEKYGKLDQNTYTQSTWQSFEKVLQKAKSYTKDNTEKEILTVLQEFNTAHRALKLRGNIQELKALVDSYHVDQKKYTEESYNNYLKYQHIAQSAIKDHSDFTKEDIAKIKTDLMNAYQQLKLLDTQNIQSENNTQDETPIFIFSLFVGISALAILVIGKKNFK